MPAAGWSGFRPEAPVPVLKHLSQLEVPGGGANVAMNIAALGGRAHLIGLTGADDEARRLGALLEAAGIETRLIAAPGRPTTFKLRILAGNHQMLRIDTEDTRPPEAAVRRRVDRGDHRGAAGDARRCRVGLLQGLPDRSGPEGADRLRARSGRAHIHRSQAHRFCRLCGRVIHYAQPGRASRRNGNRLR